MSCISCSKHEANINDNNGNSESTSEYVESKVTEEQAMDIVKEWYSKMKEFSIGNNYKEFKNLYASDVSEDVIKKDFNYFQKDNKYESEDISIDYIGSDVIGGSILFYTNLKSENGSTSNKSKSVNIQLLNENEEFKLSSSDKVQDTYNSEYVPKIKAKFGEEYYEGGYCNGDYQLIHNKVLLNNVNSSVFRCKVNSDNTVSMTIAIINGLNNDIFDVHYTNNSTVYSGQSKEPIFILDNLKIDNSEVIQSKKITFIDITINKESLLIDPAKIDISYISFENNIEYQNRTK